MHCGLWQICGDSQHPPQGGMSELVRKFTTRNVIGHDRMSRVLACQRRMTDTAADRYYHKIPAVRYKYFGEGAKSGEGHFGRSVRTWNSSSNGRPFEEKFISHFKILLQLPELDLSVNHFLRAWRTAYTCPVMVCRKHWSKNSSEKVWIFCSQISGFSPLRRTMPIVENRGGT